MRTSDDRCNQAARFWAKVFGINFVLGVVTGIPMEFQFGTNWSEFARRTGGVIGQPLVMEGVFSFFLESAFLGLVPLRRKAHVEAARTGGGLRGVVWLLAFRLLHHRDGRLDAAPGRLPAAAARRFKSPASGLAAESLGAGSSTRTICAAPWSRLFRRWRRWARTTCSRRVRGIRPPLPARSRSSWG